MSPRVKSSVRLSRRLIVAIISFYLIALPASGTLAQDCSFAPVKTVIDNILDNDKAMGTKFRKAVKDGEDSIEVLNTLVGKPMQAMIDTCRFYVAEYLAKRGYPPAH